MSRQAVGALFVVFTAGTVMQLIEHAGDALSQPSLRSWLILLFWLLKVGIVSAFAFFVIVRPPAIRRARQPIAFAACGAAIIGAAALRAPEASGSTALLLAGDALAVVGAGWVLVSVLALGRCFGFLPEARGLVTRGPYRIVRHPVYLGELGMAGGLLVAAPTAWNAAAVALLTAGQLVRMRLEEQALAGEFPEYRAYAARIPRLLPVRLAPRALDAVLDPRRVTLVVALALGGAALLGSHTALAATGGPATPGQVAPASSARVAALPDFSWTRVRRAVMYEFQLAADSHFESIVGGQGRGSFQTANTFGSVDRTVADGTYFWRVRAIDAKGRVSPWSPARPLVKAWRTPPTLLGPADGATVVYPRQPLVLRWSGMPYAYKYVVKVATDPQLAHSALPDRESVETSGTSLALPWTFASGRYYWSVTPLDAGKHPGRPSVVRSFVWSWPTATITRNVDMRTDLRLPDPFGAPRFYDPQLSWNPVPGAAEYRVEINPSRDFAAGSRVCCDDPVIGTALSPRRSLPNNTYYWRVRAVDPDGHAGGWNYGPGWSSRPSFRKDFAATSPSVNNLRVRDAWPGTDPGPDVPRMRAPVVQWDSVPGASSYEVKVVGTACVYNLAGQCVDRPPTNPCDWSDGSGWDVTTATPAWTPLASRRLAASPIGGSTIPSIDGRGLMPGWGYCVEVRPIDRDTFSGAEVRGDWTQLGGDGAKAFAYEEPPCATSPTPGTLTDADYNRAADGRSHQQTFTENLPSGRSATGTYNRRMPLLSWKPVDGACGYWVVVARDADFTQPVDLALTPEPAYAPRGPFTQVTYPEETTTYYWAAIPSRFADGRGTLSRVEDNAPQTFRRQSVPPRLLGPADGADVSTQPTFHWTVPRDEEGRPEEVRYYRLQVDDNPTFQSPIDDVITDSTAYTSTFTYPADTRLYWRVQANDDNVIQAQRGLTWSYPEPGTGRPRWFTRRLPRPSLSPDNPTGGQGIPLIKWSPVPGAVSYGMHVEQSDGTTLDFKFRSTAFTPIAFYGTGVWRWQVRANFKGTFRDVSGGYTPLAPFARRIDTPGNLHTTSGSGGAGLRWSPPPMARQYRVQISTTDSFSNIIEQATTENTNYAPRMVHPAWRTGEALYWRVAAVDEGFNVGGWAASSLRQSAPMLVKARGRVRLNRTRRVRVTVRNSRGRPIRAALVRVGGAGFGPARRTSRKGRVVLKVRGLKKGRVTFRAEKSGYLPTTTTLRVRTRRSAH